MTSTFRSLFISHGGGPMPLLGDAGHHELVDCLHDIAANLPRPDAIVVVSAHWESRVPTITSAPEPPLIYDYYGFPDEAYSIDYPVSGDTMLSRRVNRLLSDAGIRSELDNTRGFDHGLFIPLKIMYPDANIPCVQLSLVDTLDPVEHIAIGRALHDLHHQNILVLGSGFSFHNMKAFYGRGAHDHEALNTSFESWLLQTLSSTELLEHQREQRLIEWEKAEGARYCHPREEHLLPLHVCYGTAHSPCIQNFDLKIMGVRSSMYLW